MFNNFDLSDQEILKIIEDYKNLINKNSVVSGRFDEDLQQEIKLLIFKVLSKNRKNKKIKKFWKIPHCENFSCS